MPGHHLLHRLPAFPDDIPHGAAGQQQRDGSGRLRACRPPARAVGHASASGRGEGRRLRQGTDHGLHTLRPSVPVASFHLHKAVPAPEAWKRHQGRELRARGHGDPRPASPLQLRDPRALFPNNVACDVHVHQEHRKCRRRCCYCPGSGGAARLRRCRHRRLPQRRCNCCRGGRWRGGGRRDCGSTCSNLAWQGKVFRQQSAPVHQLL
mmetsp:Transcript_61252/g.200247  ORF Transcript_61252/g.200247 Transcript_61252/m.200247 type:complete len:208 (-) Transcript_61252:529-1152(-)